MEDMGGVGENLQEDLASICERVGGSLEVLAGSRVLVTGGAGFLPGYLVNVLLYANDTCLSAPCHVVCVDNLITGVSEKLANWVDRPDFTLLRQSASEPIDLAENVDYILHGASIASPPIYRRHPLETIDVNVNGTRNLLELARKQEVRGFLYISSSEVYGDPSPERIPTPETYWGNVSFTGPRACYDESKRLAETLSMIHYSQFGVPVKVVRPFNVYGPTMRLDDGRVMPDLIGDALRGQPLTLFSDGRATRSFCYVSDAVSAILLVLLSQHNGQAFNIGNDDEISIASLAGLIDEMFGGNLGVQYKQNQDPDYVLDSPKRRCPDLQKLQSAFSWKPQVPLQAGLARTIRWYQGLGIV